MAESSSGYKIPIDVVMASTGGEKAVTDVAAVEKNLVQLGKAQETGAKSSRNLGMAANAVSYQMQDFSVQVGMGTSAVTAFAQQAPQLIDGLRMAGFMSGGFGLAMMGVAAALPIVSFGAKALFTSMGDGAGQAKAKTDALFDRLKDAKKIYQEFEDAGKKDREDADRARAESSAQEVREIENRARVATSATSLEAAQKTYRNQTELSAERLRLATLEAAMSVSTGETLLRLSQEREVAVRQIYEHELEIDRIAREAELRKAEIAAQEAADKAKQAERDLIAADEQRLADQARVDALEKARMSTGDKDLELTEKLIAARKKLAELKAQADPASGLLGGADTNAIYRTEVEIANLQKQSSIAGKSFPARLTDATAARDAAQKTADDTEEKFRKSTETLEKAGQDMTRAAQKLSDLRGTQSVAAASEEEKKASGGIASANAKVTDIAKQVIQLAGGLRQPKGGLAGFDAGGFPGMDDAAGVASQLTGIIQDNRPDAAQGGSILNLINSLKNTLGAKDATVLSTLDSLAASLASTLNQYSNIKGRVESLESKANQNR